MRTHANTCGHMRTQRAKDSFLLIGRISGFDFDIR